MKAVVLSMTAASMLLIGASAAAPESLGRSADVRRPLNQVNQALLDYFSPDSMHDFQIISRSRGKSKFEITARRTVADNVKWTQWAYCKAPAMRMLDTLQQGNITVRVKLDRESPNRTYVTVTPQFEGVYQFAGNTNTLQCMSNGVLEQDILRAAGAAAMDSQ